MIGQTFRDNHVYVCAGMCKTCIYHPDNRMHLVEGRREQMERDAMRDEGCIVCHSTLETNNAICFGFLREGHWEWSCSVADCRTIRSSATCQTR